MGYSSRRGQRCLELLVAWRCEPEGRPMRDTAPTCVALCAGRGRGWALSDESMASGSTERKPNGERIKEHTHCSGRCETRDENRFRHRQTGENKELKQQFFRQYWFIENDRSVGQVLDTWVYTGTIEGQVCDQNLAAVYGYVMEPDKIAAKQNLPANLNGLSMENLKVLDHNGQLLNTDDSKWKAERGGQPDWGIRIRSVKNGRSNVITTL